LGEYFSTIPHRSVSMSMCVFALLGVDGLERIRATLASTIEAIPHLLNTAEVGRTAQSKAEYPGRVANSQLPPVFSTLRFTNAVPGN